MRDVCTKVLWVVSLTLSVTFMSGCATTDYTTHYGIFTAENSVGEIRQFRIYWQTLRYEGWLENQFRPLPVVLETQCSERKIYLYDASFGKGQRCSGAPAQGIHFCSDSESDVDHRGLPVADGVLCGTVTDRFGSTDILSLRGELLITISCRPKITERKVNDQKKNTDYLLNSEVPYVVATKQIEGADIELLIPELSSHSSICDPGS